jgi:hypothetical protein
MNYPKDHPLSDSRTYGGQQVPSMAKRKPRAHKILEQLKPHSPKWAQELRDYILLLEAGWR